jgi:hypothetical protein
MQTVSFRVSGANFLFQTLKNPNRIPRLLLHIPRPKPPHPAWESISKLLHVSALLIQHRESPPRPPAFNHILVGHVADGLDRMPRTP